MADETLLLELDVGGDSGGAEEAIASVADSLVGMQSAIDAINDSNLEALGQAGQDAATGTEAAGAGAEQAASGAEQASTAAEGATGSFDALSATAGALGTALSSIGFGELVGGAQELGGALTAMGEEGMGALEGVSLGVGALGAVGVGVFAALGMEGGNWANEMLRLEAITGLNQEGAERWATAMRIAGGDISSLERASIRLASALSDELAGKTTAATSALAKLGISATDEQGNLRSFGDVFPELLEKLSGMSNKTEQASLVGDIFGKRFAGTLLPLVQNYAEVMSNATDITGQFGIKGDDASQMAIDFNTKMTTLKLQLSEIAVSVLPTFIGALGGVSTAFTGIEDVMGPLIQFFKDNEAATAALAAVIGTALVASLIAATIAAWNLAAAMWATGIPEIVLAISAAVAILAVGLYELYVHWDDVTSAVQAAIDWFENANLWVKILVAAFLPMYVGLYELYKHWNDLVGIVKSVIDWWKNADLWVKYLTASIVIMVAPLVLVGVAIYEVIKHFGELTDAGQAVINFFSSLPDAFNSVIDAISRFGVLVVNAVIAAVVGLGSAAVDAARSAVGAVADAANTIISFLISIPGAAMGVLTSFFQWFKDHWYDLVLWLTRILIPILGLSYLIIQFREEIASAFTAAFNFIRDTITAAISGIGDALQALPNVVISVLQLLLDIMVFGWESVLTFLRTLPDLFWAAGNDAMAGLWSGLGIGFQAVWNFVTAVPGAIGSAIGGIAGALWDAGNTAMYGLWAGLGYGFQAVWGFVTSVPAAIRDALWFAVGMAWQVGSDVFEGFMTGLGNWWPKVWDFIISVPGAIVDFFQRALGIKSPSSVFADIGENMMQGLVQGMANVLSHPEDLPGYLLDILKSIPGISDILGAIGGAVGSLPDINPFHLAAGGIVTQPTLALIGEGGPEAVVPLSRPFGAAGVSSPTVVVNFSHEGPLMGDEVEARRFGAMIATMVRSEWERLHSR